MVTGGVNAASYSEPVAPGSLISIFGSNLAAVTQSAGGSPLPMIIGGTSVTVNGLSAPLSFVSPNQINAQVPSLIGTNPASVSTATVVVNAPGGSSQATPLTIFGLAPGIFTSDSSGCGQAAALNVAPDGTVSLNSTSNSAAPGDYLEIFGTGLGTLGHQPPDGSPSAVADGFDSGDALALLGGAADPVYFGVPLDFSSGSETTYSGAAPTLVGVDQVNFQIPSGTRDGCAVPLVLTTGALLSQVVTVSINANRGKCVDPPQQSYGQVTFVKTVASGTSSDGETDEFVAKFPSAPSLAQPSVGLPAAGMNINETELISSARMCLVPGYSKLSAGTIQIQPAGLGAISVQPIIERDGVEYQMSLPTGFVGPGEYTITSSSGSPVSFQETMTIGSPIKIQTSLVPGTVLSSHNLPTIHWTGGDANSIIRVTLIGDVDEVGYATNAYYVSADAGTLTLPYIFGLAVAPNKGELIFDVLPANGVAAGISAEGISQQVQFSWAYRYVFGGLSVAENPFAD